ncbi:MAG: ATP-binding protein [Paracoccaceae bacterium]
MAISGFLSRIEPPPGAVPAAAGAAAGALAGSSIGVAGAALGAALGAAGGLLAGRKRPDPARSPARSPVAVAPGSIPAPTDSEVLDRLPAALVLVDAEQRVRRINPEALRLIADDTEPDEEAAMIGQPLVALIRAPGLIDAVDDALTDQGPRSLSFTLMRARVERALQAHIRPLKPNGPRGAAALILIEDRTRIRQMEEMRQDFIANASHELKTPLASIIGFIETLQGPAKDDDAARVRFLKIMATQAERMKRLVEDLMSLSRIEMNAHVRPTALVDLVALAQATAAALEPLAAEAGARIVVVAPAAKVVVSGEHDQLAQLLTNLIDNAVKYGGEGVTVTIREAAAAPEWPGMVGLTVEDDGPGIPREHLPRLTERFYRVSAARSRAVGGTGLGLAIAKHILQRHRGELQVRSTLGEGAAFTIWLPMRAESPPSVS